MNMADAEKMTKPVRLQRSRVKGARLVSPNGLPVFCVTRPSDWGNPFKVGLWVSWGHQGCVYLLTTKEHANSHFTEIEDAKQSVDCYRRYLRMSPYRQHELIHLRGKNLACWCKPGAPCHADVLLELANAPALAACEERAG